MKKYNWVKLLAQSHFDGKKWTQREPNIENKKVHLSFSLEPIYSKLLIIKDLYNKENTHSTQIYLSTQKNCAHDISKINLQAGNAKILVHLKANNISIDKIIHKQKKITIFELFPHLISFNELVWQEHNGKTYTIDEICKKLTLELIENFYIYSQEKQKRQYNENLL